MAKNKNPKFLFFNSATPLFSRLMPVFFGVLFIGLIIFGNYQTLTIPSQNSAVVPTPIAESEITPLQALLIKHCATNSAQSGMQIAINKLPFNFSPSIVKKYSIGEVVGCFPDSNYSGYKPNMIRIVSSTGDTLLIGDSNSLIRAQTSSYLDYKKHVALNKNGKLIYENYKKNIVGIIATAEPTDGYCPTDSSQEIELRGFRDADGYKVSAVKYFTLQKSDRLRSITQKYGTLVSDEDKKMDFLKTATYKSCSKEYLPAVVNEFIPSYDRAEASVKIMIDEMSSDMNGITVK